MITHEQAKEMHRAIADAAESASAGYDGKYEVTAVMVSMETLERAAELAALVVADTEPHPADNVSYAPCITGKIEIGDTTSEFMLPLLNDSMGWSQWGADNRVLGERVELLEALADGAGEWAQEHLCRTCKENLLDDNEGYDGECGNCADKTAADEDDDDA